MAKLSKKRGPKPYQPSDIERRIVRMLAAEDVSLQIVRRHVNVPNGLSLNTLKKRFQTEIAEGRITLLREALLRLRHDAVNSPGHNGTLAALYLAKRYGTTQAR